MARENSPRVSRNEINESRVRFFLRLPFANFGDTSDIGGMFFADSGKIARKNKLLRVSRTVSGDSVATITDFLFFLANESLQLIFPSRANLKFLKILGKSVSLHRDVTWQLLPLINQYCNIRNKFDCTWAFHFQMICIHNFLSST